MGLGGAGRAGNTGAALARRNGAGQVFVAWDSAHLRHPSPDAAVRADVVLIPEEPPRCFPEEPSRTFYTVSVRGLGGEPYEVSKQKWSCEVLLVKQISAFEGWFICWFIDGDCILLIL